MQRTFQRHLQARLPGFFFFSAPPPSQHQHPELRFPPFRSVKCDAVWSPALILHLLRVAGGWKLWTVVKKSRDTKVHA